jgi:hypothetical protein
MSMSEILSRKFPSPSGNWPPNFTDNPETSDLLDQARAVVTSIEKTLEPFAEEARVKITDAMSQVVEVAGAGTREARSALAGVLKGLADRIKPE